MPAPEKLLLELWWEEGTRGHTSQLAVPKVHRPRGGSPHPGQLLARDEDDSEECHRWCDQGMGAGRGGVRRCGCGAQHSVLLG